ncbi:MAG: tetratricopeptide repeat protein [Chloroflexi bacterium]|nr:tetratricopeptide repeat protein [Chloroflexota bacterium]
MLYRADKLFKEGRFEEARDMLVKGIGSKHGDTALMLALIRLYFETGEFGQALELALKAESAKPNNPAVQLYKGRAFLETGDMGSAKKAFDRAIEIEPENRVVSGYRALISMKEGSYKEAVDFLEPYGPIPQPDLASYLLMEMENSLEGRGAASC